MKAQQGSAAEPCSRQVQRCCQLFIGLFYLAYHHFVTVTGLEDIGMAEHFFFLQDRLQVFSNGIAQSGDHAYAGDLDHVREEVSIWGKKIKLSGRQGPAPVLKSGYCAGSAGGFSSGFPDSLFAGAILV